MLPSVLIKSADSFTVIDYLIFCPQNGVKTNLKVSNKRPILLQIYYDLSMCCVLLNESNLKQNVLKIFGNVFLRIQHCYRSNLVLVTDIYDVCLHFHWHTPTPLPSPITGLYDRNIEVFIKQKRSNAHLLKES